jgi:hypothetical protein
MGLERRRDRQNSISLHADIFFTTQMYDSDLNRLLAISLNASYRFWIFDCVSNNPCSAYVSVLSPVLYLDFEESAQL